MPTTDPLVNWLVGIVIALVIAFWADSKRQGNERHAENVKRFEDLGRKIDAVNGRVTRHDVLFERHGREIERLREAP